MRMAAEVIPTRPAELSLGAKQASYLKMYRRPLAATIAGLPFVSILLEVLFACTNGWALSSVLADDLPARSARHDG
jgi:hypothetical protein